MFRNLRAATFGKDSEKASDAARQDDVEQLRQTERRQRRRGKRHPGALHLFRTVHRPRHHVRSDEQPVKQNDPDALVDFRNPAFDLDNVYGRGPDDQPIQTTAEQFLLGDPISGGHREASDLPRGRTAGRSSAIRATTRTASSRNCRDCFYASTIGSSKITRVSEFAEIQQLVRFHYQYVILNDFLPRLVSAKVLEDLKTDGRYDRSKLKYYHWKNDPFMPVEFSVAAYRLGHSMVRPGYRMNDGRESLLPIFPDDRKQGLTGFRKMGEDLAIDWGRFIDIDTRDYDGPKAVKRKRLQFAYRIDTSLVHPLSRLPQTVASHPSALAERNLLRSWRLGLPSGQDVARAMGVLPLADEDIIIGQGVDNPGRQKNIVEVAGKIFADNCPLWTYVLAEAMHYKVSVKIPVKEKNMHITTPQLGPVGGRIVAEVFLGLMFGDTDSMLQLDPLWQPKAGKDFALKDVVKYALEHSRTYSAVRRR